MTMLRRDIAGLRHAASCRYARTRPPTVAAGTVLLAFGLGAACYGGLASHDGADTAPGGSGAGADAADTTSDSDAQDEADSEAAGTANMAGTIDESGGDEPGENTQCDALPDSGPSRLRRLTRRQYASAVYDLLAIAVDPEDLPRDERLGQFTDNIVAPVDVAEADLYLAVAENMAASVLGNLAEVLPCAPAALDDACAHEFASRLAYRAFRRPLTDEELLALDALFSANATEQRAEGIRAVIEAILQSPDFLYRVERGTPSPIDSELVLLDGHSIATRLSFLLWGTTPSDHLLDAAGAGELDDAESIRDAAATMLADPRAGEGVGSFHVQWLGVDELVDSGKSAPLFPTWTPELVEASLRETAAFTSHVVLGGSGSVTELLTADYTIVDPELAAHYGLASLPVDGMAEIPLPPARSGILTHASVLATHATPEQASPVRRGTFVLRTLLCAPPSDPPPTVDTTPPPVDPNASTRERYEMKTSSPQCAGCHRIIHGIGYGFLAFDAIGRHITVDAGKPIDDSGEILGISPEIDGPFQGVAQLADRLATSPRVRDCLADSWFAYAFGRIPEETADACSSDLLRDALRGADGNIRSMLLDLVSSDAFRHARRPS